jgi:FkbH-like protein
MPVIDAWRTTVNPTHKEWSMARGFFSSVPHLFGRQNTPTESVTAVPLAAALDRKRHALALGLRENIADWEKYAEQIAADRHGDEFVKRELYTFIDYLALYFRTGEQAYKNLYIGEKLKQLYQGDEDLDQRRVRADRILEADERVLVSGLTGEVEPDGVGQLRRELAEIRRVVMGEGAKTLAILLVGDCLFLDIQAFLTAQCLEDGIALDPAFATAKNGPVLRNELRKLSSHQFDVIFYSPYSYEFSPQLAALGRVQQSFDGIRRINRLVDETMVDTEATLHLLASQFECPVFVHNTVNVRRHDGSPRERLKNILTRRSRRLASKIVNTRLADALVRHNATSFEHLFPIDETALLDAYSGDDLGRKFYDADLQHPAFLGLALAGKYRDLLAARAGLLGRKLLVCDLDNTLWAGEIGEGAVIHDHDRQRAILELKRKGVVLAVNSKNDPNNVRWDGGLVNESDFVNLQINWDSKVTNMRRIREALNLKYQDYVFIDDRADQLEQVSSAFPEIRVLDATRNRSWRLLEAWAAMLPSQIDGDRTQFYREREARESFMADQTVEDQGAQFANLGIRVTIRETVPADHQRVTELINRTNQFNLAASRTSFDEISQWHVDPAHTVLIAEAADKFGKMGLICAAVLRRSAGAIHIPIFVLSCRVFGYGIETSVLNVVKRLARNEAGDDRPVVLGSYTETAHNAPCRSMYPEHGFNWDGSCWVFRSEETSSDPAWLSIEDRLTPRSARVGAGASLRV